ncbi:hypothetical protein LX15_003011 [Streptoalloteichus tenebrarius]|uniref:Uncharacterized protein n=1 Tax=Streptoalloteichus tenebrarius (strain ATCC 17920 / DSM 40477 / JCM 4838 / CBS 697.72 / NBRC 16177 / NCIMB 11028 / NRRL B-12390 / A12253. 1 / ISP 5477) TaxID=1933 RepID=A0ABT1HV61_STRSD|nr:hypothetical protein [Streptoalloteichus tenebrarius]
MARSEWHRIFFDGRSLVGLLGYSENAYLRGRSVELPTAACWTSTLTEVT